MKKKYTTEQIIEDLEVIILEANTGEEFRFYKQNQKVFNAIVARLKYADTVERGNKE